MRPDGSTLGRPVPVSSAGRMKFGARMARPQLAELTRSSTTSKLARARLETQPPNRQGPGRVDRRRPRPSIVVLRSSPVMVGLVLSA